MLAELNFSLSDFGAVHELLPAAAVDELCKGTIDATILVVGHPSAVVADAIERCGAKLIAFDGPLIRDLLNRADTYQRSIIDLSIYGRPGELAPSLSVVASLVTRTTVDDDLVADLYAAIDSAAPRLAEDVLVLKDLRKYLTSTTPLGIPLHHVADNAR